MQNNLEQKVHILLDWLREQADESNAAMKACFLEKNYEGATCNDCDRMRYLQVFNKVKEIMNNEGTI